jgi:hypothetical protein
LFHFAEKKIGRGVHHGLALASRRRPLRANFEGVGTERHLSSAVWGNLRKKAIDNDLSRSDNTLGIKKYRANGAAVRLLLLVSTGSAQTRELCYA